MPAPMPLEAPVTIATLLDSLLIFTIVLDPTPVLPNVHHCGSRLVSMKISIYAPMLKSVLKTARHRSILHPEPIVGNPESDLEDVWMSEHCRRSESDYFPSH